MKTSQTANFAILLGFCLLAFFAHAVQAGHLESKALRSGSHFKRAAAGVTTYQTKNGKQLHAPSEKSAKYQPVKISPQVNVNAPIDFTIHLGLADNAGLSKHMEQIASSNGTMPWLKLEDLKKYTMPSKKQIAAVEAFLKSAGMTKFSFDKLHSSISVTADVTQVEKLFNTKLTKYSFESANGQTSIVLRTDVLNLPSSVADLIIDVSPLLSFSSVSRITDEKVHGKTSALQAMQMRLKQAPASKRPPSSCDLTKVTPDCLKAWYKLPTVSASASKGPPAVGVIGLINQFVSQKDLKSFSSHFIKAASDYSIPIQLRNSGMNDETNPGVEAMLDVETVVGASYPLSNTFLSYGITAQTSDLFLDVVQDLVENFDENTRPQVISISYGAAERSFTPSQAKAMCQKTKLLSALGTTVVVASGDNGVLANGQESCPEFAPTYPCGCPYILCVGATQGFAPEVMTDYNGAGFYSAAGASNFFRTPSYQRTDVQKYEEIIGDQGGYYNKQGRMYPDIAAQGSNYAIVWDGEVYEVSGTSASTPLVASIFAIMNAQRAQKGLGTIGWPHPQLYKASLPDIRSGGAYECLNAPGEGLHATKGWDAASGNGTPLYPSLKRAFNL